MKEVTNHYPDAKTINSLKEFILDELKSREMEASNTVWGTSVCSDEVTNIFSQFNDHFIGPGPFRFGGISGLPFTGKTGFKAFASHIPDNGDAFILYGPHIGISEEGITGEILREGQQNKSTCCGSLLAGLENIKNAAVPQNPVRDDYQQSQVNKLLIEKHEEITSSENPVKTITDLTYQQISRELKDIISACDDSLKNSKILLIGGIVINTDWNKDDFFEVRDVMVIER